MGILEGPLRWVEGLPLPKGFTVCELGDQMITCMKPHKLAKTHYEEMGCSVYVSLDGNGKATHLADLNKPVNTDPATFDLVTDFGTGEHIFNQAQVWVTLHNLTKEKGFIVFDRPISGYPGHGFYLCDPSLFKDIAAANGYRILEFGMQQMSRGMLCRGVFQKMSLRKFQYPQQGRYQSSLKLG